MTYELDPLTGDPIPKSSARIEHSITPSGVITDDEINKLQSLSRNDLLGLCMRMGRQCGLIACLTPKETAQAITDRFAEIALVRPSNGEERALRDVIAAGNNCLDRLEGKPMQNMNIKAEVNFAVELNTAKERLRQYRETELINVTPNNI